MMKILFFVFISLNLISCSLIDKNFYDNEKYLNSTLKNKTVKEILNEINDGRVYFIGEPPCALSKIRILSEKKMIVVSLRISQLPLDLRERLETCNWKIEEFYEYTPSEILIESVDQDYIRRSNIKH
jgi:hypothetical protein